MTAIVPSDILFYLSAPGASAGNTTTSTPENSLGKYISTTQLSNTPLDNLFTDITGAQNAASQVDYQCLFILNNTASGNSMLNTVAWLPSALDVGGGATVQLAADPTAASAKGTGTQQAVVIASATTAPVGVSGYVSPSATSAGGVNLGTIPAGFCKAVWIQRTAHNTSPVNNDGFTLEVDFDTQG